MQKQKSLPLPGRFLLYLVALSFLAPLTAVAQNTTKLGEWSGTLVSSACNPDEAFNESTECNKDAPGAQLALYDDTNRIMYTLVPQKSVTAHLGDSVTVRGTLDDQATIQIASFELLSIGLAVGQKAPVFSVHDQFGHIQTLDTLKGPNGTVLLFFRSADW